MNLPTSIKRNIDVNAELIAKRLEPCNNIDVLIIPSGVTAYISFKEIPLQEELYPLYTNATCQLKNIEGFTQSEQVYLFTYGTSTENLILNLSVINSKNSSLIINKNADEMNLNESVLSRLGKAIEPYEEPTITMISSNSTTETALLSKTLTSDKIKITFDLGVTATHTAILMAKLDNKPAGRLQHLVTNGAYDFQGYGSGSGSIQIEHNGVKGKLLEIRGLHSGATLHGIILEEYTKKL